MELTLFIIVGAIAVIAAAMMLISENAIYSALFLILNFACIAFLFFLLNAPFLAIVQITVYAGAIMVLFLFVIMLLGAERIHPALQTRFRWVTPAIIVLALAFLITVSVAILNGNVDLTVPREETPQVRAVHVVGGVEAVDVYLDGTLFAAALPFRGASDFEEIEPGSHEIAVYSAGADPDSDAPLLQSEVTVTEGRAFSLTAIGQMGGGFNEVALVQAAHTLNYSGEKDGLRVTVVNALPGRPRVDVRDSAIDAVIVSGVGYGEAREFELSKGEHEIGVYATGSPHNQLATYPTQFYKADTLHLLVFAELRRADNSFEDVIVHLESQANTTFGSPTHVGRLLFSKYVLPFEIVSVLLLVAMIGAIVLTHEPDAQRRRVYRRLANPPIGLDQSPPGDTH